jgi:hypothetical protein
MLEKRIAFLEKLGNIKNPAALVDFAAEAAKDEDLPELLDFLKTVFRDAALRKAGCGMYAVTEEFPALGGGLEAYLRSYDSVEDAQRGLERFANKTLLMEALLIDLLGGRKEAKWRA